MIAQAITFRITYDVVKGGVGSLIKGVDHQQAVSDAAGAAAAAGPAGLTHDDLYGVFQSELSDDVLADVSTDSDDFVTQLAAALADRHRSDTTDEVDYESVIIDFLDHVEKNLISQGRPEEGVRILYQYAREITSISEEVQDTVERLHRDYIGDLEELSNVSLRMAPNADRYRLRGTGSRIDRSVEKKIVRTVEEGGSALLAGEAGTGKSGVLSYLYEHWEGNRPVYFIDAREYGRLESRGEFESELGLQQPITDVFRTVAASAGCCTIIIDQLDNIRIEQAAGMFTRLLKSLADLDDVTVVCACRRWDLERPEFESLRNSPMFTTYSVSALNEDTVRDVLTSVGVDEDDQAPELIVLGRNLLTLSLLIDAISADEALDPRNIENEREVWDAYRQSLGEEGSGPGGTVPYDWDETPVERAATHARKSLLAGKTTFEIEDSNRADQRLISRRTIEHIWGKMHNFRHDQLQAYFFAYTQVSRDRYVQAVLDTGLDQRLAADVFEWMLKLYLKDESRAAKFLREAVSSRSPLEYYARLRVVEAAGRLGPDRLGVAQAKIVAEALDSNDALRRDFYRTIDSQDWVRFVLDYELLTQSDRIVALQIASLIDEAPGLVLDALERYDPETVSPTILREYVDALEGAAELETDHAAAIGDIIVSWIEGFTAEELSNVRTHLGTVLRFLLKSGQGELAKKLVFILTEPIEESEANQDGERRYVSEMVEAPIDIRRLNRLLEDHIEELSDVCGASFVDVLEERLQQCLEMVSDRYADDIQTEYAFRRPFMNTRWNPWKLQDVLIPALETAIERRVSADPDAAEDRLQRYIRKGGVYWQIAAHLLSQQPTIAPQVVRSALRPPTDVDAESFRTEYLQLLDSGFSELSESEQQKVIEQIQTGPDRQERERVLRERRDWESEEKLQQAVQTNIEKWKLMRFWQIQDHLPSGSQSRAEFDELCDSHGEVQFEHERGFFVESSDRESEPADRLNEMDSDTFIEYCMDYAENAAYVPRSVDDAAFEDAESEIPVDPSGELRARILSDQGEYLPQLPSLVEASTGTDELIEVGFEAVVSLMIGTDHKDKKVTEWSSVVDAYEKFLAVEPINENWSRDCRLAAADLLWLMINPSSTFEAIDHLDLLKKAILAFTDDPDPEDVPLSEEQLHITQTTQNPQRSTASVRAKGTLGLVGLLEIVEYHPLDAGTVADPLRERLINLLTDDGMTVQFALGWRLPTLYSYDSEFVEEHLNQLLPTGDDPESRVRFVSTWSGYITNPEVYKPMFDKLKSRYQHAVSLHRTADFEQHDQSVRSLCTHIAIAYAWEFIDTDDDLVQELLQIEKEDVATGEANGEGSPPAVLVANTFDSVLRSNEDRDGHHERWERIIEFWRCRMEAIVSPTNATDELQAYTQILRHAPREQSLTEIKPLLCEATPAVRDSFSAITLLEYLERRTVEVRQEPEAISEAAIEVLDALTRPDELDFRLLARDESWTIVRTAAEDGHETALTVAERFLEAGHPEYKRIIDDHRFDDRDCH